MLLIMFFLLQMAKSNTSSVSKHSGSDEEAVKPNKILGEEAIRRINSLQQNLLLNQLTKPQIFVKERSKKLHHVHNLESWNDNKGFFEQWMFTSNILVLDTVISTSDPTPENDDIVMEVDEKEKTDLLSTNASENENTSGHLHAIIIGSPSGEIFFFETDFFNGQKSVQKDVLEVLKNPSVVKLVEDSKIQKERIVEYMVTLYPSFDLDADYSYVQIADLVHPLRYWVPSKERSDKGFDLSLGSLAIAFGGDDFNPMDHEDYKKLYGDYNFVASKTQEDQNKNILVHWTSHKISSAQKKYILYKITTMTYVSIWVMIKRLLLQPIRMKENFFLDESELVKEILNVPMSDYECGMMVKNGFSELRNSNLGTYKTVENHLKYFSTVQPFSEGFVFRNMTNESFDQSRIPEDCRSSCGDFDVQNDYTIACDRPDKQASFTTLQQIEREGFLHLDSLNRVNQIVSKNWVYRPTQENLPVHRNDVDSKLPSQVHKQCQEIAKIENNDDKVMEVEKSSTSSDSSRPKKEEPSSQPVISKTDSRKRKRSISPESIVKSCLFETTGIDIDQMNNEQLENQNIEDQEEQKYTVDQVKDIVKRAIYARGRIGSKVQIIELKTELQQVQAERDFLKKQMEIVLAQNKQQNEYIKQLMEKQMKEFFSSMDANTQSLAQTTPPIPLATPGTSSTPTTFLQPQKIVTPEDTAKIGKIPKVADASYAKSAAKPPKPVLRNLPGYKPRPVSESEAEQLKNFVIRGINVNGINPCNEGLEVRPAELHAYRIGRSKKGQKSATSQKNATNFNPSLPGCQTCGMNSHDGDKEECTVEKQFVYCLYCENDSHNTSVCHILHAICVRCGVRGHRRCKKTNTDVNLRRFRDRFEKFADLGALTSLRREQPYWGFLPYPAMAFKKNSVKTKEDVVIDYDRLLNVPVCDAEGDLIKTLLPEKSDRRKVRKTVPFPSFNNEPKEKQCSNIEWMYKHFYTELKMPKFSKKASSKSKERDSSADSTSSRPEKKSSHEKTSTKTRSSRSKTRSKDKGDGKKDHSPSKSKKQ